MGEIRIKMSGISLETAISVLIRNMGVTDKATVEKSKVRFATFLKEWQSDVKNEPKLYFEHDVKYDEMVAVGPTNFTSFCEHHLLMFTGEIMIAYIPNPKVGVIGVSKFSRIIDHFSHRLQLQERLTHQIADFLEDKLGTSDVAVWVNGEHACMRIRGVRQPNSRVLTDDLRGKFKSNQSTRMEFLSLVNLCPK